MLKFKCKCDYKFCTQVAKHYTLQYLRRNNILDIFLENSPDFFNGEYYDINRAFLWSSTSQKRRFWCNHYLNSAIEINDILLSYKKYGLTYFYKKNYILYTKTDINDLLTPLPYLTEM